jgi:hypothetical protein
MTRPACGVTPESPREAAQQQGSTVLVARADELLSALS